jgi:hypothetical protein
MIPFGSLVDLTSSIMFLEIKLENKYRGENGDFILARSKNSGKQPVFWGKRT